MAEEKNSKKNKAPSPLKGAIEACGRHPFATGLFAILGFFGLIFAFYDFNVSQTQAEESSVAQAEIKSEIEQVGAMVEAGPVLAENREGFDPIEAFVDLSPPTDDNVVFDPKFINNASLDFSSRRITETIKWLQQNDPQAISDFLIATFSVKSAADRDFVQIAPYIVVQVMSVEPISSDLAAIDAGERGAAASVRELSGVIMPQTGLQFLPLTDSMTSKMRLDVDFFTLQPREPEEFVLYLSTYPEYRFKLRIGLHYKFQNSHSIHWVSEPFTTGQVVEDTRLQWTYSTNEQFVRPNLSGQQYDYATSFREGAAEQLRFAERSKVFRPSQIPVSALTK